MCKIEQFISYRTFLSSKFIDAVLAAFTGTVPVTFSETFADTLSAAFLISLHVIFESPIVLTKYSPFSQLHVAGFYI